MTHSFTTNTTPATGAIAIYSFLTTLTAATWTRPKDSDGTTYSSSGVQLTTGATGTNGLGNTNAWFVVRDPNAARSFCFQRGSTNLVWRVKYSRSAGFVGGSPSATQVPSASDEVTILGSGSDASPGFATMLNSDGSYRFNCCATDTTLGYSFYFDSFPAGSTGGARSSMYLDIMAPSSFPASDLDPAVVYFRTGSTLNFYGISTNDFGYVGNNILHAHFNNGGSLVWQTLSVYGLYDIWRGIAAAPNDGTNVGLGVNSFTSKDDLIPVPYGRNILEGVPAGWKGYGQLLKFTTKYRTNYDTLSVSSAGAKDYIFINGTVFPWDGSTPTI